MNAHYGKSIMMMIPDCRIITEDNRVLWHNCAERGNAGQRATNDVLSNIEKTCSHPVGLRHCIDIC